MIIHLDCQRLFMYDIRIFNVCYTYLHVSFSLNLDFNSFKTDQVECHIFLLSLTDDLATIVK